MIVIAEHSSSEHVLSLISGELTGKSYSDALDWQITEFDKRFERTFELKAKGMMITVITRLLVPESFVTTTANAM